MPQKFIMIHFHFAILVALLLALGIGKEPSYCRPCTGKSEAFAEAEDMRKAKRHKYGQEKEKEEEKSSQNIMIIARL
jgi:hypothetical protein